MFVFIERNNSGFSWWRISGCQTWVDVSGRTGQALAESRPTGLNVRYEDSKEVKAKVTYLVPVPTFLLTFITLVFCLLNIIADLFLTFWNPQTHVVYYSSLFTIQWWRSGKSLEYCFWWSQLLVQSWFMFLFEMFYFFIEVCSFVDIYDMTANFIENWG